MLSCDYIGKIIEILKMYGGEGYIEVKRGSCNICLGKRQGKVLLFDFSSNTNSRIEFAHQECLEGLLSEENFMIFVTESLEKIEKANLRLQVENN